MCGPPVRDQAHRAEREAPEVVLRDERRDGPETFGSISTGSHRPPANASGRLIRLTMPGAPAGGMT